jgi:hypothetical protein
MTTIIFNNNITVSVTQTPENPMVGDDVAFKASVALSKVSIEYKIKNNYFFSYIWLVSSDGGDSFYQVGSDLEELVVSNIDQNFFNNIYKVQVALIDLDNIILTENGDNLTTQFGEILLLNSSSSSLAIQSLSNNSSITNLSISGSDKNLVSIDTANLETIIADAANYDTTINSETSAEVFSGQIKVDKLINSQTTNGTAISPIQLDLTPETVIETDLTQQSIMGSNPAVFTREFKGSSGFGGRVTTLSYDVCGGDGRNPVGGPVNCCDPDEMVTIKNTEKDIIAKVWSLKDPNRVFKCCKDGLKKLCEYQIKSGIAGGCYGENKNHYAADGKCQDNFERVGRNVNARQVQEEGYVFSDCGCNGVEGKQITGTANFRAAREGLGILSLGGEILGGVLIWTGRTAQVTGFTPGWVYAVEGVGVVIAKATGTIGAGGAVLGGGAVLAGVAAIGIITYIVWDVYSNGYIYRAVAGSGKPLNEYNCEDVKYYGVYECDGEEIIDPDNKVEVYDGAQSIPTTCDCVSEYGETYSGSITVSNGGKGCDWYVETYTGKPGSSCICNIKQDIGAGIPTAKPFTYTVPVANTKLFSIENMYGSDCIKASGECNSKCDGPNCCPPTMIWKIIQGGNNSLKCDGKSVIIKSPMENNTKTIEACNLENNNKINIIPFAIMKVLYSSVEKNLYFDSEDEASQAIKTRIGKDNIAVVFYYEETDGDTEELIQTAIRSEDDLVEMVPALYKQTKNEFKEVKIVSNIENHCDLCKTLYSVSSTKEQYPCDDNGHKVCGSFNAKCNTDNSNEKTTINLVKIKQIKNPTIEQIEEIGTNYYDNLAAAKAEAESQAGDLGVVCPEEE